MSVTSGPRCRRGFAAFAELLFDVDLDLVHGHVTGAFDHHLAAFVPRDLRQFAECFEFGKLSAIIGVGDGAGAQAVAQGERDIVGAHDVANVFEVLVEETFTVMARHHFAMIEPPRETMPVTRCAVSGT